MADCLLTPPLTVFEHMALDELLARQANPLPVLRFYHWVPGRSVTFGYSQFVRSVQQQITPEQGPLCRRPTGGGIVFHGEDLTFSLIFQTEETSPQKLYALLHGSIEQYLTQLADLSSTRQGEVDGAIYAPQQQGIASGCFANPVENDLLSGGKKILGGAIRRFGQVILYQGSLQCPNARTNPLFRRAVTAGAVQMLGVQFAMTPVPGTVLTQAKQLAIQQYRTKAWTEKFI